MNLSQIKLQNTEVVIGLVGSQSIAQPGDTSKYFTRTNGGESERVYVDGCTTDTSNLFSAGNLNNYIEHAVKGGTSALFISGSGITRLADYDRKKLMSDLCRSIDQSMAHIDPDISMTYAFVGITDNKLVNLQGGRNDGRSISADKLENGLAGLHREVEDWAETEHTILQGTTLPFILSLHFESFKGVPTNGHLCLVDLNLVSWMPLGISGDPSKAMLSTNKLHQSAKSLSTLVHLLANDAVLSGATIPNNALVSLVNEFLNGECKTAFILYLNTDDGAAEDMGASVDLIKSLRKLRSREIVRPVDRRVMFFYEKAKFYQDAKYRLQDELAQTFDKNEQLEKDLDDIQSDFSAEREALAKEVEHWQAKSKTLEETMQALKSESACIEADVRWENAKLVTEKLALKDELRRAEVEMTAAEDSNSKLIDLYEGLQSSYNGLDSVYSELLNAYRKLKDRFGTLAEDNLAQRQTIGDLETWAEEKAQRISELKAEITSVAADRDRQLEALERRHAQDVEALEIQISAETQRAAELAARVAQLETENKSLSVSQSREVADLQSIIHDLSSQLEISQRQTAAETASMTKTLRASENLAKRLESENTRLTNKVDELMANDDIKMELADKESQWGKEREQLTRQITRLQQTAENAERRESELREESEAQWSSWEAEKNRNHEKYLKLKDRFREAVEYAADVQVKLEEEREGVTGTAAFSYSGSTDSANGDSHKHTQIKPVPQRKAPAKIKKPAIRRKSVQFSETVEEEETQGEIQVGIQADDGADAGAKASETDMEMEIDEPAPSTFALPVSPIAQRASRLHTATRTRTRNSRPNYAESDDNDDNFGLVDIEPGCNRRVSKVANAKPRISRAARSELPTPDAPNIENADSDDSEITFNTSSILPPVPAAKPRKALRGRKTAEELDAELRTQPARRRAGTSKSNGSCSTNSSGNAGGAAMDTVEVENIALQAKKISPKRKRAVVAKRAPRSKALGVAAVDQLAESVEATVISQSAAPAFAAGEGAGANTLKKKRKLNLNRMRNLLGLPVDRSAMLTNSNPQAIKFMVPKIGPASSSAGQSVTSAASEADPYDTD
ncbi:hypothetical protein BX661DRAFT_204595 [Kickxella alabastrina]|uniref:uncharacterized protein n=1 Tax=Kickxella alabastrina TaxID=61397 RepID=UPI00221F38D5|nr:uncharacterized protein BX661DRAFT_204595 [Kickxella alabastrina]KAI7831001.1 hypothetical protein BX661DRAFT_204595 [Kickxella alabastrina]